MDYNSETIDLIHGFYLQIGGELGKNNELMVDYLVDLSSKLQELVIALAKNDSEFSPIIDIANFKVALCGYKTGSAVPQFRLAHAPQATINDSQLQRRAVNKRFNQLMKVAEKGTYYDLKDIFPNSAIRNAIVGPMYEFLSSTAGSPMAFVEFGKSDKPVPVLKVKKFKKEVKNDLITKIIESKPLQKKRRTAFAIVNVPEGVHPIKRTTVSIDRIYELESHAIDYATDVIEHKGRTYHLRFPIRCGVEIEDEHVVITSEILGIVASGNTEHEAQKSFMEEFDYLYQRLNQLSEDQLTKRVQFIKSNINHLVTSIE